MRAPAEFLDARYVISDAIMVRGMWSVATYAKTIHPDLFLYAPVYEPGAAAQSLYWRLAVGSVPGVYVVDGSHRKPSESGGYLLGQVREVQPAISLQHTWVFASAVVEYYGLPEGTFEHPMLVPGAKTSLAPAGWCPVPLAAFQPAVVFHRAVVLRQTHETTAAAVDVPGDTRLVEVDVFGTGPAPVRFTFRLGADERSVQLDEQHLQRWYRHQLEFPAGAAGRTTLSITFGEAAFRQTPNGLVPERFGYVRGIKMACAPPGGAGRRAPP
jgi:hypothetical protein